MTFLYCRYCQPIFTATVVVVVAMVIRLTCSGFVCSSFRVLKRVRCISTKVGWQLQLWFVRLPTPTPCALTCLLCSFTAANPFLTVQSSIRLALPTVLECATIFVNWYSLVPTNQSIRLVRAANIVILKQLVKTLFKFDKSDLVK